MKKKFTIPKYVFVYYDHITKESIAEGMSMDWPEIQKYKDWLERKKFSYGMYTLSNGHYFKKGTK